MKKKFQSENMRGFLLETYFSETNIYVLKDLQGNLIKSSENISDLMEYCISLEALNDWYKRKYKENMEFQNSLRE